MKSSSQAVKKQVVNHFAENLYEKDEIATSPAALPGLSLYLGIFLTSASVLLFELALTRIFAVVLWAHLAFMVVSTALFGFGLSGVYLALKKRKKKANLAFLSICVTAAMIASYLVVTNVPFKMWDFQENPINFLYLGVWYMSLVVPFFFAGLVIADLLSSFPKRSSRLYGVDLIGAAAGSFLMIPLITLMGGEGMAAFAASLSLFAALCYAKKSQIFSIATAVVGLLVLLGSIPNASELYPLQYFQNKRRFNVAQENGKIYQTRWSPLSKVDIAYHNDTVLDVWIDGGTNESGIIKWNGTLKGLKPMEWSSIGLSHKLKQNQNQEVMIIGPSGGKEVLFALSHGANHVDAVELDPSIVKLLSTPGSVNDFMGGLYNHEKVTLTNDEGRAFLRRQSKEKYDIVQFVNNYTPVAIAAGALNLSETFLVTKESFHDFYDHLKPGGILALHRGATIRVALTAMEALREKGIENPEKQIMITAGEVPYFEGFLLKKGEWTKDEEKQISQYMKVRPRVGGKSFLWTPFDPGRDNLYSEIMSSSYEKQKEYYTSLGINLYPATDDQPFVEHFLQFGTVDLTNKVPQEFHFRNGQKWRGLIPRGDFPYFAILVESAILGLLFVGVPLMVGARGSVQSKGFLGFLAYFSALGFGFITVEICLMKRYVLFLGNPAYSISTILVALLLGAGIGSVFSEKLSSKGPRRAATIAVSLVALAVAAETFVSPIIFDAALGLPFAGRILVASAVLLPLGFAMGLPFPVGLSMINKYADNEKARTQLTAWAWGMNGYFTVIGSAASVFIALFAGFKAVLVTALAVYLLGMLAIRKATA